jgi:hypothetical protein
MADTVHAKLRNIEAKTDSNIEKSELYQDMIHDSQGGHTLGGNGCCNTVHLLQVRNKTSCHVFELQAEGSRCVWRHPDILGMPSPSSPSHNTKRTPATSMLELWGARPLLG